eukprot:2796108-Prymnesium_polylepis.1
MSRLSQGDLAAAIAGTAPGAKAVFDTAAEAIGESAPASAHPPTMPTVGADSGWRQYGIAAGMS